MLNNLTEMRKTLTALLLLLLPIAVLAQEKLYRSHNVFPYIIITKDTVTSLPQFTDDEYMKLSSGVVFAVNKADISPSDPFLSQYRNEVLPIINDSHLQLRKVFIRGAASPEGSYANNQRLGRARSQALLNELRQGLKFQYIELDTEVSSVTEDYGYLCQLMKEAGDADYNLVKEIFDGCNGDEECCKKRLMAAKNKTLWPRLLKQYFPRLRSARLVLWFSEPDAEHAPEPKIRIEQMDEITMNFPSVDSIPLPQLPPIVAPAPAPVEMVWARRHMVAIRTNLIRDFLYMPDFGFAPGIDVQLEYYPLDGHYTYNAAFTWTNHRHWDTHEFFQARDAQLELRRYFHGQGVFMGPYVGAYAEGTVYGIGLSETKGWEGEGGGAGLTIGYVMPINKKGNFRLEFMASAGYFRTYYDPYVYGNPITGNIDGEYYYNYLGSASNFKKRNHRFTWLGPTNIGVNLTYDIIYRKKNLVQKGGKR